MTKEEVDQAKLRLQTAIAYAKDFLQPGAASWARHSAPARASPMLKPGQRIASVTPELVNEAARQVLRDERAATGHSCCRQPPKKRPPATSRRNRH